MDPFPRTHKHLLNSEFLVGQFPIFCALRCCWHNMGGRGLKSERRHVYRWWTGSLRVQRPLWMKESFFLSEEGLSLLYVALTHSLCNAPPNRGFFQCAGEAKCSEVWKPDTRIVKSSSNGPRDPGGGTWKMSCYCSSPPFSYECVQFKGIRSGLVCAAVKQIIHKKKKKKKTEMGDIFIQHVQRPHSRRRSGWDGAEKQGWGPTVSPWHRRLAAVLPFPHLLQARTDDIHL